MDEVSDISRVRHDWSDRVLGLWDDGSFVHPADTRWLADDMLQGVRLLQLAQVIVLRSVTYSCIFRKNVCEWVCLCLSGSHLVLFSSSLLIIFENVVPDIILWVNKQLLGLPLLLSPLDPDYKQQHHTCTNVQNS